MISFLKYSSLKKKRLDFNAKAGPHFIGIKVAGMIFLISIKGFSILKTLFCGPGVKSYHFYDMFCHVIPAIHHIKRSNT